MSDDEAPYRYTAELAGEIEARWQDFWDEHGTFDTPNPKGRFADPERPAPERSFFVMDMFPYPSGEGLHVGHPLGYIATDVVGRFHRMRGENVLHALGYDAFGLPAEQYAVQTGQHPRITTNANIANMRRQLRRLGLAHDRRRSFATIDPGYVRWTQWIFLQLFESWYDTEADDGRGRALPIADLVAQYEKGDRDTPDGRAWADLTDVERKTIIDDQRLAYISEAPVNWAPGLGTVLANEEVTADGRTERGNVPVFKRNLRQWMLRITAYADRLIDDLDLIDWPDKIKTMQRNWIGRSHGAHVHFPTDAGDLTVFTTRPDTVFGATFMVVAPEHSMVETLTADEWPAGTSSSWTNGFDTPAEAVAAYRREASTKSEVERQVEGRDKTGVFTGSFATNPVTGTKIPVLVADYVLMGYGTGAIMAVPGQDERDWEFATRFDLPIVRTVAPPDGWEGEAYTGGGPAINSSNDDIDLNGLDVDAAKERIIEWLEDTGRGSGTVTYRLRDWLFSRQRYWGEPFPIVFDENDQPHAIPDHLLPVDLPDVPDYSPKTYEPDDADSMPEPPLARVPEWVNVELDLGDGSGPRTYRRDTNTMPNWAGSCWYELRYLDPEEDQRFVDPELERYWMGPRDGAPLGGVDLYIGGVEHGVLHLLYSRFWHKVLYDLGHVGSQEPFHRLFNQGYIQAYAFTDDRGAYVPAAQVVEKVDGDDATYWYEGRQVNREYGKIGKSLKNVVSPDEMYDAYGADTLRVYEMSMGPLDLSRPWETRAVVGSQRFLQRLWRNVVSEADGSLIVSESPADDGTRRLVHHTIDAVTTELAAMRVNTTIARLIELNNHLTKLPAAPREAIEPLVLMLAPIAPHLSEELWHRLGHDSTVTYEAFPVADPELLVSETVTCVVQVAGKVRDRLQVPPDVDENTLRSLALESEAVQRILAGRPVRTVIVRAPKLVNVVPG